MAKQKREPIYTKPRRDFTARQFQEACKRNDFKPVLLWLEDTSEQSTGGYGMVLIGGKINRRISLAEAIRKRENDRVRAEEKRKVPA